MIYYRINLTSLLKATNLWHFIQKIDIDKYLITLILYENKLFNGAQIYQSISSNNFINYYLLAGNIVPIHSPKPIRTWSFLQ